MDTDGKLRDAAEHIRETARLVAQLQAGPPIESQLARARIAHMVTDPELTLDDWSWHIERAAIGASDHREIIEVTFTMSRTVTT